MSRHIAIFGATGYIGTKLLAELYDRGERLTLFARNTRKLRYLNDGSGLLHRHDVGLCIVETAIDPQQYDLIRNVLEGVDAVYYLVHSLYIEDGDFKDKDDLMAKIVATAAKEAGVEQIIYLGGLGVDSTDTPLSKHLQSRQNSGRSLREHHPAVTEFRAGVIIGEGSASFELIRSLATKLPLLPDLGKREGHCQPIFVSDVISYLIHALLTPEYYDKIAEIGSDEVLRYRDMVQSYAQHVHKRRMMTLSLPFMDRLLSPKVISWFASRMSGMPYQLIYLLIEGVHSNAIIHDHPIKDIDPDISITPLRIEEALKVASKRSEEGFINSLWSTPYELSVLNKERKRQLFLVNTQETDGLIFDEYHTEIPAEKVEQIFKKIKVIGGKSGYYSTPWFWKSRGFIDKLLGGPGLNQWSRRSSSLLRVGDRIDFWVVTCFIDEPHQKVLRLKANMKAPGTAWLQFSIDQPRGSTKARLSIRPYFDSSSISGYLYWYSLSLIHKITFKQMLDNISKEIR